MTIEFAAQTGILRLTATDFDRLIAGTADDDLRDAGAMTGDTVHPAVAAGMTAVTEAVCGVSLRLRAGDTTRTGDGWVAGHGAALLLDAADGKREFVTMRVELLPAAIARLVGLGPRPRGGDDVLHLTHDEYRGLITGGASPHPEPGTWRYWAVSMNWRDATGTPCVATIEVLDGEDCLRLFSPSDHGMDATPTTATEVWRRLTLLLPDHVMTV